jgi:hypothetical protein
MQLGAVPMNCAERNALQTARRHLSPDDIAKRIAHARLGIRLASRSLLAHDPGRARVMTTRSIIDLEHALRGLQEGGHPRAKAQGVQEAVCALQRAEAYADAKQRPPGIMALADAHVALGGVA